MSLASFDLGGGGNAFPFDNVGDSVTGRIISIEEQQQTDMDSGQPAVWDSGQPKMMVRVELQTDQRDPANPGDDGKRSIYLKGSRKPESMSSMAAVIVAVRNASGATTLQAGGTLTLTYAADGVPTKRGWNAPKHYTATYVAPSVDLMGDTPAPAPAAAAPVQQAPAPAPQAAPAAAAAPAPAAAPTPEQLAAFNAYMASQQATGS